MVPARSPWTLAAIGLALMLLLSHTPLLRGRAAPIWDGIDFFAPYYMLVGDFARSGQFLLWNPFTLGGSPDYLEPQLGSFSPPLLLFGLVFGGTRLSFELYWLAIWLFGGVGVLALARHLGAPPWGGLVSAVGFAFSGVFTGNAENTAMLYTFSFLPWLVWRVDVALTARGLRPAIEAGALYGLSALGGYPALVLLNGGFVVLWSIGRVLWSAHLRLTGLQQRLTRTATVHILLVLVGAAVMSPTYVPFFVEGPDVSDRAGAMAWDDAVENDALHPAAVATLVSPVLSFANLFDYTDISMRSLYVGCLVPVLAGLSLFKRRDAAFRWWLLLVAVMFLAAAMGRALPVRGWLYEWFPPTRYFRHPALFRCYTMFALVLLGISGASDLAATFRTRDPLGWRRFRVVAVCLAAVALAVYGSVIAFLHETTPPPYVSSHWHTFGSWLFVATVAAAGSLSGRRRWRELAPVALVILALADAASTARLVRPTMYDGQADRWHRLDDIHRSDIDLTAMGLMRDVGNGGNSAFVSKIPTLRGYSGLAGRLVRRYADDELLAASASGENRLWYSTSAGMVDRSERCFDAFRARAAALDAPPLVIHAEPVAASNGAPLQVRTGNTCEAVVASLPAAMRANSFKVWEHRPARLTLRVDVPEPGWLLVTDTWSRGWRVAVNGRARPVVRGNFVFRVVQVSTGTNFVDFHYEVFGFPWLLMVSWGLLAGVGVWSAAATASASRQPHADERRGP